MAVKLDKDAVKKIADLAKIELTQDELETYGHQITSILEYVEKLKEVETTDIYFRSHVDLENVMHEDVAKQSLDQQDAVGQTNNEKGYVVVPAVIE